VVHVRVKLSLFPYDTPLLKSYSNVALYLKKYANIAALIRLFIYLKYAQYVLEDDEIFTIATVCLYYTPQHGSDRFVMD